MIINHLVFPENDPKVSEPPNFSFISPVTERENTKNHKVKEFMIPKKNLNFTIKYKSQINNSRRENMSLS